MSGAWCWVGRRRLAWGADVPWASHHEGLSANCWCFLFKPKSSCSQSLLGVKRVSTLYLCCTSLLTFISRDFQASSCCLCLASHTHHPTAPKRVAVLELALHQPHDKCSRVSSRPGCQAA